MHKRIARILIFTVMILSTVYTFMGAPTKAHAAALTLISDEMSRIQEAQPASHRIRFRTPTGFDAPTDTVTITFPAGFVLTGVIAADVDICHTSNADWITLCNDETVAGSAAAGTWGFGLSGQVITLTAPSDAATTTLLPANDYVTIKIGTNATGGTHNITNPAAGDGYKVDIAGLFGDTGYYGASIIANDQLIINARADQTLSYTITANTIDLTTLSIASIKTATVNMTAATNASRGYEIKYYGGTLTYGAFTISAFAPTGAASSIGNEQFGLRVSNAVGGVGAAVAPYSTTNYALDTTSSATNQIKVAGANAPSALTTYTVEYGANISPLTEPGSYTTTHTWICTGLF